ncbi:MAG: aminotransferase class I/II-fold pyridoxal phosphate-dependent enzyme [Betaproteobacteria bacterium]|nr:aminotransferase class I/II-fold pyridoxal phosphate-dependent enzyme [Betaproteobacteria bacterium]
MGFFATRLDRIKHSPSNSATQRVRELRAQGRNIVGLTMGEPDFETPAHVKQAVITAMARNETHYTAVDGISELKDAVQLKFRRDNQLEYAHDQIIAGSGSKQLVFNAMMSTLSSGDEVIIPAPYWVSYLDMVLVADGTPVAIACGPEDGFKLTPERLEAAITPRTKWLILNSPCNPTGAVYTRAELKALAEVLLRHPQVWVLSDDIYEHLLFDGAEFATIAEVEPALLKCSLTVNGVSKAYAMTGWRLGYAGGPKALVRNMAKLQSQSTSNPSSISQWAAVEALTGPQEFLRERAASFQQRRDLVLAMLNEAPGIECAKPQGAFYVYPNCAGVLGKKTPQGRTLATEQDFTLYLLDEGVAVIQGEAYGLMPYFRVSIAAPAEELAEACRRIQRATSALV